MRCGFNEIIFQFNTIASPAVRLDRWQQWERIQWFLKKGIWALIIPIINTKMLILQINGDLKLFKIIVDQKGPVSEPSFCLGFRPQTLWRLHCGHQKSFGTKIKIGFLMSYDQSIDNSLLSFSTNSLLM